MRVAQWSTTAATHEGTLPAISARSMGESLYPTRAEGAFQSSGNSALAMLRNEYDSENPGVGGSADVAIALPLLPVDDARAATLPARRGGGNNDGDGDNHGELEAASATSRASETAAKNRCAVCLGDDDEDVAAWSALEDRSTFVVQERCRRTGGAGTDEARRIVDDIVWSFVPSLASSCAWAGVPPVVVRERVQSFSLQRQSERQSPTPTAAVAALRFAVITFSLRCFDRRFCLF